MGKESHNDKKKKEKKRNQRESERERGERGWELIEIFRGGHMKGF